MAVKIRLKRFGKKKAPFYRVIVIDGRAKRDGRAIEEIGKYHPLSNPSFIDINSERAQYWLSVGAQPSDQVRKLLELTGDWGQYKGDKDAKSTVEVPAGKASADDQIKASADAAEKLKADKAAADEKAKKEAEEAAKAEAAAEPAADESAEQPAEAEEK
ncbi:30S ribosomal protein S16 [Demequina sediminicola]|uniref:30S ribosomal protein S16 n=1 Tax=Demequina sediminicola TaxID=1095026 RepID=UPI000784D488|nr:30S ribosomal protein S16 [Demequina sediminicola]